MSNEVAAPIEKHFVEWAAQVADKNNPFGHAAEDKIQETFSFWDAKRFHEEKKSLRGLKKAHDKGTAKNHND